MPQPIVIPEEPAWLAGFTHHIQNLPKKALQYRFFQPEAAPTGPLPLVVYLHGIKGRGEDNESQMRAGNRFGPAYFSSPEVQARFPSYIVAPQCPKGKYWVNFNRIGSTKHLRKVIKLVDELKAQHAIDPLKVYVVGQSMGGFGVWAALIEYPQLFAGGICVSGGGNPRRARTRLSTPIWMFHGALDPLVGVWRCRQMQETLERGGKEHRYTEYPEGRHDIWSTVFGDMQVAKWLFAQRLKGE